jgi:hypothetical protein
MVVGDQFFDETDSPPDEEGTASECEPGRSNTKNVSNHENVSAL